MLSLVTGVPGASKTAFVVTELDKIERHNKINLERNKKIHQENKSFIEKYQEDFSYYEYEQGSGHERKTILEHLPEDYFNFLHDEFDDLRPDYYFQRSSIYNEIIDRIHERENKQLFKQLLPVRTIYTNIKALKIDYVRANIYDWREAPDGSIIVIDEVQLVEPYSNVKDKNNDIVQELTIHRHRGFDFYFITQSPSLLHPTIKELIGVHYHITRPYGRTPKIYRFGSCRQYPNTMVNKLNCEAKYNFKPNPRIFKLYKSTSINTHQSRYPKGVFVMGLIALGAISFFFYNLKGMNDSSLVNRDKKLTIPENTTTSANTDLKNNIDNRTPEQREAERQENFQNELAKNAEQLTKYDVNKPYDFSEVHYQYNVIEQPQLAGCAIVRNQCTCYTQQATRLNISQSDCNRYMSGDKPFNPFKQVSYQNDQSNYSGYSSLSSQQNTPQNSLAEYAKYQEYQRLNQEYQRSQPQQQNEITHGFG